MLEISSDYSDCSMSRYYENNTANYVFLFDEEKGFLISVKGTPDMETLEHIARELEIRESDEATYDSDGGFEIGMLDLGRG